MLNFCPPRRMLRFRKKPWAIIKNKLVKALLRVRFLVPHWDRICQVHVCTRCKINKRIALFPIRRLSWDAFASFPSPSLSLVRLMLRRLREIWQQCHWNFTVFFRWTLRCGLNFETVHGERLDEHSSAFIAGLSSASEEAKATILLCWC